MNLNQAVCTIVVITLPGVVFGGFWSADPTLSSTTEDAECDWSLHGDMTQTDDNGDSLLMTANSGYDPNAGTLVYYPKGSTRPTGGNGYNQNGNNNGGSNGYYQNTGTGTNSYTVNGMGTNTGNNGYYQNTGGNSNGYSQNTGSGTNGYYQNTGTGMGTNGNYQNTGTSMGTNGYYQNTGTGMGTNGNYQNTGTSMGTNGYYQNTGTGTGTNDYYQNTGTGGTNGYYQNTGTGTGANTGDNGYYQNTGTGNNGYYQTTGTGTYGSSNAMAANNNGFVAASSNTKRFKRQVVYMNPNSLSGLHPTLPIGSFATVTQPETGKSVTVQIVGRPVELAYGRCLTLSKAAFAQICELSDGVTHCTLTPNAAETQN